MSDSEEEVPDAVVLEALHERDQASQLEAPLSDTGEATSVPVTLITGMKPFA